MSDQLPVIVINLPGSRERRNYMQAQADRLGFVPEFFPAVDGRQPHPLFDRVDSARRLRFKGKPFTPGEKGCWASHFLVWQRCVALDRPVIVLEDDATLGSDFSVFLAAAEEVARHVPYARLYLGKADSRQVAAVGQYAIHRHRHTPFGAVAYLLTPGAARRFLKHANAWVLAVDDYMDLSWLHGVERLAISPPLIELDQRFTTQVQTAAKPPISIFNKLQRELFRAYLSVRDWLHSLHRRW